MKAKAEELVKAAIETAAQEMKKDLENGGPMNRLAILKDYLPVIEALTEAVVKLSH